MVAGPDFERAAPIAEGIDAELRQRRGHARPATMKPFPV